MKATIDQRQATEDEEGRPHSLAERVTLGIALTLVLAVVGLVLYDWLATPAVPPQIIVTSGKVEQHDRQWYVPFTVENVGGDTAEAVQVIAELQIDGEVVEDGEQQIDFLSGGETEAGAFVFDQDPGSGELTVRVASFKLP